MSAIARLRAQGFEVRLTQTQSIAIKPAGKLPDKWRAWIADNRRQVVSELQAASTNDNKERLAERWQWFLSLATEHGIHPCVVGAEFPAAQDWLDMVEPVEHDDDMLRACMTTLCCDIRVKQRQEKFDSGQWEPVE